jgi:hypothetical protein
VSRLPNLVIVGAAKSGTTSLWMYLSRHPQVQMSRPKELNFFHVEANWERGLDWYASHFRAPGRAVYGEASPVYATWPLTQGLPARMHAVIPGARLIYVVRDPIERMISNWTMRTASGRETRPIEVALRDAGSHIYLDRSRYHMQLGRFLEHYAAGQVLVVDSDELRDERRATLREVFRFLGVDDGHTSPLDRMHHNQTAHLRPGRQLLPSEVRTLIGRGLAAAGRPRRRPGISPELRAWLAGELRDDARRLREATGRGFAGWSV